MEHEPPQTAVSSMAMPGYQGHEDDDVNELTEEIEKNIYHSISEPQEQPEALMWEQNQLDEQQQQQTTTTAQEDGITLYASASCSATHIAQEDTPHHWDNFQEETGDDNRMFETADQQQQPVKLEGEGKTAELKPPKRPLSAFFYFSGERRPQIQKEHPELRIGQVQSKIGEEWNNLDPEKKTKYHEQAAKAKEEYQKQVQEYKEKIRKHPELAPSNAIAPTVPDGINHSIFPLARVKKIVKADPEIHNVSKEAMMVAMKAAEYFAQDFLDTAMTAATRSGKRKVDAQVIGACARKFSVYEFLADDFPADLDYSCFDKAVKDDGIAGQATINATEQKELGKANNVSVPSKLKQFLAKDNETSDRLWHQSITGDDSVPHTAEQKDDKKRNNAAADNDRSASCEDPSRPTGATRHQVGDKNKKAGTKKSKIAAIKQTSSIGGFFQPVDSNDRFAEHSKALSELSETRRKEEERKEQERKRKEEEAARIAEQENSSNEENKAQSSEEEGESSISLDALRAKHGKRRRNDKRKKHTKKKSSTAKRQKSKQKTPEPPAKDSGTNTDKTVEDGEMIFPSM